MTTRLDTIQDQGVPVWVGEFGFYATDAHWAENQQDICDLLEARGMGYGMFAFGLTPRWNEAWDIADSTDAWAMNAVGTAYSNYVQAL
jgi:hypothetical protein